MIKTLYGLFYTLACMAFIMMAWVVVGTDFFLRVSSVSYGPKYTTIVRDTPFGEIQADWVIEARVADPEIECPASGSALYQKKIDNTVTYQTPSQLQACLESKSQVVVVRSWSAKLFGVVPLRPTQLITIIDKID